MLTVAHPHILLVGGAHLEGDALELRELLAGADVERTETLAGAHAALAAPFDLVLVESTLPDSAGREAVLALVSASGGAGVLVLLTPRDVSRGGEELVLDLLGAGADECIGAHGPGVLTAQVRRCIQRSRHHEGALGRARTQALLLHAAESTQSVGETPHPELLTDALLGEGIYPSAAEPGAMSPTRECAEDELRTAMERGEITPYYQPVVDLHHGKVVGVEALARWEHPTAGVLLPGVFIPVAEAGGLVVELGSQLLREACAQVLAWDAEGLELELAVNLSTRQVAHPGLYEQVRSALEETGLDPQRLTLEVTETSVMEDMETSVIVLNTIAELGVSLSIDDFGTGYSSLVYLKRYPIRALKVDRSFVSGLGMSARDDAIVSSVVGLARAVGGACIAEGIETPDQYASLLTLGCEYGQGWLFGKAVPGSSIPSLVSECEYRLVELRESTPPSPDERDHDGVRRDRAGDARDVAGDARDHAGDRRDERADQRDAVARTRDEQAHERDQLGDHRDVIGKARDEAGQLRDTQADLRDSAADLRDDAADQRDGRADERDEQAATTESRRRMGPSSGREDSLLAASNRARAAAAADRDQAAEDRRAGASERLLAESDRDVALADREAGAGERDDAESDRNVATAHRGAGAGERDQADSDRDTAQEDRRAGAGERSLAGLDRHTAHTDRGASAHERGIAATDGLTGVYQRDAGQAELERELQRARRNGHALTVAFIDVDRLKQTNDTLGHAQGDRVLRTAAGALVAGLRRDDLVMRYGGDEFLCSLSGVHLREGVVLLQEIADELASSPEQIRISVGLAELRGDESSRSVIARADAELYARRERRRRAQPTPSQTRR